VESATGGARCFDAFVDSAQAGSTSDAGRWVISPGISMPEIAAKSAIWVFIEGFLVMWPVLIRQIPVKGKCGYP
jgi:hypothetical protein